MTDPNTVADEIRDHLTRYVRFISDHEVTVLTLWVLHTHALKAALATPYMCLTSPVHSCGKSTLLTLLADLVANQVSASNTSVAALFRSAAGKTVLLDEVDSMLDHRGVARELEGVLRAGYSRSNAAGVARCEGETFVPKTIGVFGPKLLAGIDLPAKLSTATLSRCIEIRLERALPEELLAAYGTDTSLAESNRLTEAGSAWAQLAVPTLKDVTPTMPEGFELRWQQIWTPLFAIAELLGDTWPARTTDAYKALVPELEDRSDEAVRTNLLADLRRCFDETEGDNLTTAQILQFLNGIEGGRWESWGRRRRNPGLDARDLAELLRPFGIKPKTIRTSGHTAKGYRYADLAPQWERILGDHHPDDEEDIVYDKLDDPHHGTNA